MRAKFRALLHRAASVVTRRVRLPLVRKAVPIGILLLVGLAAVGGAAIKVSAGKLLCVQCHEMSSAQRTWRVSSHKEVPCEDCHVVPSLLRMARAKVGESGFIPAHRKTEAGAEGIAADVPDSNCKRCHPETRDIVVYHGLKITHRRHWDRGIRCITCHANVVHGPNASTKNTPSMRTCFRCHDGRKAPNDCGLCHETLGVRRRTPFSPEWVAGHREEAMRDRDSCRRCHQEGFCDTCHRMATPHPENWLDVHPVAARRNADRCLACHPGSTQESFCGECHSARRAHKVNWVRDHPQAFRRDPRVCDPCHRKEFCSDCHSKYRAHPADWLQKHPGQARTNPKNCETCHKEAFCAGCHQHRIPVSHRAVGWAQDHGSRGRTEGCQTCHRPAFCMSCHKTRRPRSHEFDWRRLHAADARRSPYSCNTCHTRDSCQNCHGISMPHPKNWLAAHRSAANRGICGRCHEQSDCNSCHRGTRPESHRVNWVRSHGAQARRSARICENCHTREFCSNCHASARPASHKEGWTKAHGRIAQQNQERCSICHGSKSCMNCHKTEMPHPKGFIMRHKAVASFASDSLCFRCHERSKCTPCHGELGPASR